MLVTCAETSLESKLTWAVRGANIVVGEALAEALDVVGGHSGQELDILLGVEPVHVWPTGNVGSVHLQCDWSIQ